MEAETEIAHSGRELWNVASSVRNLLSTDRSTRYDVGHQDELKRKLVSQGYQEQLAYLPVDSPEIVVGKTVQTYRSSIRLLTSLLELTSLGGCVPSPADLTKKAQEPYTYPSLQSVLSHRFSIEQTTTKVFLDEVSALSRFECLVLMGILYEQSRYEFITHEPDGSPSILTNMTFANRRGTFFTPPEVANFITGRIFADLKSNAGAAKNVSLSVLDPACGGGIFLLCSARALEKCTSTGDKRSTRRHIALGSLYGVDIEHEAAELAKLCIGLYADFSVAEIQSLPIKVKVGNSLISNELTGLFDQGSQATRQMTLEDADNDLIPFDWNLEFPEILSSGGFDVVLLNPPYGRLKVHRSDFTDKETLSRIKGRALDRAIGDIRIELSGLSEYFRKCGNYTLSVEGELDWYKLMLERSIQLLRPRGTLGCIIPASILADRRTRKMRKYIIEHCETVAYQFPETAKLFRTVNQPTCILFLRKSVIPGKVFAANNVKNPADLWKTQPVAIDVEFIKRLDPKSMPIPIVNDTGFNVLKKIHRHESIGHCNKVKNMRGELDVTLHKKYLTAHDQRMRLIRGDCLERFVIRTDTSTKSEYVDDKFLKELSASDKLHHVRMKRIVGRQCSYMLKKRRLSFAMVNQNVIVGNSCNYLVSESAAWPLEYLLGFLNSSIAEWRFRLTNSNNHVGNYEIDQIPVPEFRRENQLCRVVVKEARALSRSYEREAFGMSAAPYLPKEDLLDAATFLLFGMSINEVSHVMKEIGESSRTSSVVNLIQQLERDICPPSMIM